MTPQEAFKLGFLARCVEENLSQEKIAEAALGLANLKIAGMGQEFLDTVTDLGKGAVGVALAAPPAAGALTAYLASKASDPTELDVEEIRKRELLDEYRRAAQKLEQQNLSRLYKQKRKTSNNIYL